MEITGDKESVASIGDVLMLMPAMRQLNLDEDEWTFSINAFHEGKSGMKHRFDLVISSIRSDAVILSMLLKKDYENRMARIMSFYTRGMDCKAPRLIIMSETRPDTGEKMLLTSLGIELHILPDENTGKVPDGRTGLPKADERPARPFRRRGYGKKHYRDRTQIVHEILASASELGGATITRIISSCNLNYRTGKAIIDDMLRKELLTVWKSRDDRTLYSITRTGSSILEKLYFYKSLGKNPSTF